MTDSSPFMLKDEVQRNHPVNDLIRKRAEAAGLFPRAKRNASSQASEVVRSIHFRMDAEQAKAGC
jgi:hypothetical protein